MTGESNKLMYLAARHELLILQSQEAEAKRIYENLHERVKRLQGIVNGLEHSVCLGCHGHGKLTEWLAQDETRLIACTRCNGSGLSGAGL